MKRVLRSRQKRMSMVFANVRDDAIRNDHKGFTETYASLLQQCCIAKDISEGREIHRQLVECGHDQSTYLGNLLVQMYGACGNLEEARKVFDRIDQQNVFSWNIMIGACVQNGQLQEARSMFEGMPERNVVSWTAILTAYAQEGHTQKAESMFAKMPQRNVVSWNAMITTYTQDGDLQDARCLFNSMPERDVVSWNVIITAYAQERQLEDARILFEKMPQRNVVSWTAMSAAYAQTGNVEDARILFNEMPERGVQSWNAMITGYALKGHVRDAMGLFERMPERSVISWNAMLTGYAQNGNLEGARNIFDETIERDLVSWNSIITAYAQNGHADSALELFKAMNLEGVQPDDITMLCVLSACSHGGLFEDGLQYYLSLSGVYGIVPTVDHYVCMIDLLGRSGQLKEAEELLHSMPFVADVVPWTMLFGACRLHVDLERGARAAEGILELEPENTSPYLLLLNMYAAAGKENEVAKVRMAMRKMGVKEVQGQSCIDGDFW